ncbi:7TM diverse intracellular signaling domain-containing protein [Polaromonas sp. YR568]|uniref:sensor domain-containing diguanylate cyclase n=1 Tax=Polaromonas sp. YR568 TaxID=1855301 RepID=UPI001587CE26|nr:7TM diverse intracellular signaling domain-containing protein [Polaromonas sp. YR568]
MLAGSLLQAGPLQAQPVLTLNDAVPVMDVRADALMWIDAEGTAAIEQLTSERPGVAFTPAKADTVYSLGPKAALWLHYRFTKSSSSRQDWLLEFPLPLLDLATVYQRSQGGSWTSQSAGDTVAVSSWPEPGRYGQFQLNLRDNGVHDVYVRIQHLTEVGIPIRVSTRSQQAQRLQLEYLAIGVVFGALVLLIVACAVQSWVYRDKAYGWYAVYASVMALVVASWTGVAGHLLWSDFSAWNNLAQGCLGLLGGGAALLVVHHLCGIGTRHKGFERVTYWVGVAGLPLALVYTVLDRGSGVRMIGIYLILIVVMGVGRAYLTWQRKDIVGFWVLAAFTPLALATLLIVVSILGLISASWLSQYGLMAGLTIEVPMLLVALNLRSRERHAVEAREQAMSSQDALTGLLAAHLFHDRFMQVVERAKRYQEPAAVVYIELVNYRYIKKTWGTAVAEQSLLRSVIKLRRILRDVNTVGRVDEARFGLILEGVASRTPVTELSARLIAAGLMPLKGLKPEVVLQFHVAGVLLSERLGSHEAIAQALADLLHSMGARTRRPIRFLEPELTHPMPLGAAADSGFDGADSGPRVSRPPRDSKPPVAEHGGRAPTPLRAVKSHSNR